MGTGKGNPLARCPNCGYLLDGYTSVGGDRGDEAIPRDGDFSICASCKHLLVFRADQTVRTAGEKEVKDFRRWWKQYAREQRRERNKKMN